MNLDGLKHRDYLIGGGIVVLSGTLLVFGLTLTVLFVVVALVSGVTYVYFSDDFSRFVTRPPHGHGGQPTSHGQSAVPQNVAGTSVSPKKKWKVTIGKEHTPVSSPRGGSSHGPVPDTSVESFVESTPSQESRMFNWTWSGSPSSGTRRLSQPGMGAGGGGSAASTSRRTSGGLPLPRVVRVHNSSLDQGKSILFGGSPGSGNPLRRYPTHQPQYTGLSTRPVVHLRKTPRRVLNDRNTSMLTSPVTVKVAPPDVLKPPTPSIVPVRPVSQPETQPRVNPCDTQTVLTAIREKRKRTIKEEEEAVPVVEKQDIKRRRQAKSPEAHNVHVHGANGEAVEEPEMDISPGRASGLKRPAISRAREESICVMENELPKRSRSEGPPTHTTSTSRTRSSTRNPIDVSYSSSRGIFDRKNDRSMSESRAMPSSTSTKRSVKHEESDSKNISKREKESSDVSSSDLSEPVPPARSSTPRRLISLLDQDVKMADDSKSSDEARPKASSSSPQGAADGDETPDVSSIGVKKTLFPLSRDSSSRRRHTPIRGDSNAEFNKVPTLRYSLTVEDYAQDRAAEMARVQQMLEEVETDAVKPEAKPNASLSRQGEPSTSRQASASITKPAPSMVNAATPALNFGKLPTMVAPAAVKSSALPGVVPSVSTGMSSSKEISQPVTTPLTVSTGAATTQKVFQLGVGGAGATLTTTSAGGTGLGVPPKQLPASIGTAPSTTSVNTLLFKHTPTTDNTQIGLVVPTQGAAPAANPGLATSVGGSVSSSQAGVAGSQYSFKPVFGAAPESMATATNMPTNPPPSYGVGVTQGATTMPTNPPPSYGVGVTQGATNVPTNQLTSFSVGVTQGATAPNRTATNSMFTLGQQPSSPNKQAAVTSAPSAARSINFGSSATASTTSVPTTGTLPAFGVGPPTQTSLSKPSVGTSQNLSFAFSGTATKPAATTHSSGATTNTTSIFTFGGAQPSTSTASTPAFNFGAGAKSAFGSAKSMAAVTAPPAVSGFGTATNAAVNSAFGSATSSTSSTGGFAFNAAPTASVTSTSVFGQQPASTTTSTAMFGQPQKTTTSAAAPMFGQTTTPAAAPSVFGQTNSTAVTGGGVFGSTQPQPAQQPSSTFQFGAATSNKPSSTFQFGGSTGSTTTQSTTFNFNATKASARPATSATLQFGQAATSNQTTAATNSFGTNAFGTTPSTAAPAFGGNNAFGASSSQSSVFGQSAPGSTQNAFNSSSGTTQNAFGSSGTMQNAFGSSGATTGVFGTATATAGKGFDFSGAASSNKPSISFGGGQQPSQPQAPSATFAFGNNPPAQNASFAFGGGNTSFGTPQSGTGTPVFGTPAGTPVRAPNPFGQSSTPGGQGAFTVGSGNTQPRPRTMVRAARRRTTKR